MRDCRKTEEHMLVKNWITTKESCCFRARNRIQHRQWQIKKALQMMFVLRCLE